MIVLTGMSCSGKTAILKALNKYGYEKTITCTTRPPRKGERDGRDYWFISDEIFDKKIANNEFAEFDSYNTVRGVWRYGSLIDSYINSDRKSIILTPNGIKCIREELPQIKMDVFYIHASEFVRWKRMKKRGDDKREATRRMMKDREDFKNIGDISDYIISNDGDLTPIQIAKKIINIHEQTNYGSKT